MATTFGEWFAQEEWYIRWVPFVFGTWAEDVREGLFEICQLDVIEARVTRDSRLGDFCQSISMQLGTRPVIRPWRSMAGECYAAGAFLSVKSILAAAGTDVSKLSPSTPLNDPRFGIGLLVAIRDLVRLSPETCPAIGAGGRPRDAKRIRGALVMGMALFIGGVTAGLAGLGAVVTMLLVCSGFAAALAAGILAVRAPIWPVIPGMNTYRDLAYVLAGQQPRCHPLSSPPHDNRGGFEPGTQA
jgi:hypothetical protein